MERPTLKIKNVSQAIFGPSPLEDEFNKNKKILDIFKDLKIGEKLGKQNDNSGNLQYYKVLNYRGLWLTRWYYGESRFKTIEYLDHDFTIFMQFLDKLLKFFSVDPFCIYTKLAKETCEFVNEILPGLYSLKKTYPLCTEMVAKVDSIILTLIDFKERVQDNLREKQKLKKNKSINFKSKEI